MKSYKITLEDIFSSAKHSKNIEITDKQAEKINQDIADQRIVKQEYKNGIHWNWKPVKLELIGGSMANG